MPRSYREINQYETEIINLYNQRMTLRAIAEKLGFTHKQVQEFKTRYNKKQRMIEAGKAIHRKGRPPKDNRMMFNAILWIARSGAAWADIPERYGPHQSVYSRFYKWRDDGTLENIFHALNEDADFENLSMDSTSVKAHPQNAGAKKGL